MTSESLVCFEKLKKGAKRRKNGLVGASLLHSNWSFSSNTHLTSELLAEVGVGVLDDDDSSSSDGVCVSAKPKTKVGDKRKSVLAHLEPTPPASSSSCTAPPKTKHHRSDTSKKQHGDDQTPFKMRRRLRVDAPTGQDAFTRISDEMVLQIFKWLPKTTLISCARTCKRLKRLSYDHSLWTRANLGDQTVRPDTLTHVLGRGVVALRLAKSDIQEPQNISLPSSFTTIQNQRFCKLQHLDLSMSTISEADLEGVMRVCHKLRNLSLEHCKLNDKICECISANRKLEKLNLTMCSGLTEIGMKSILTQCDKLSALNLAWTGLSHKAVDETVNNLPIGMQYLNLSGCRQTLKDNHVIDVVLKCVNLKELDISDAVSLTEMSITGIVDYALELESLALTRCYTISKADISNLIICPKLLHLQIFGLFTSVEMNLIKSSLEDIAINKRPFSDIARPTTGISRTSIWGLRVRD